MALKGDRVTIETDTTLTCPTATLRGVVLCLSTSGSGVTLGDVAGVADLFSNPSGKIPAGILLNDMVNVDTTRYHINFQKNEQLVGQRCTLMKKGRLTTDQVSGTPTAGNPAYLTANGQVTPTKSATGGLVATPPVGMFKGGVDENGFATVEINLPTPTF